MYSSSETTLFRYTFLYKTVLVPLDYSVGPYSRTN